MPGLPSGGPTGNEEPADPGRERDTEIDDREQAGDAGQKAEESETGRDTDTEAASDKKGERPPGSAVFQGRAEEKHEQDAGGQGREQRGDEKEGGHGFASLRYRTRPSPKSFTGNQAVLLQKPGRRRAVEEIADDEREIRASFGR